MDLTPDDGDVGRGDEEEDEEEDEQGGAMSSFEATEDEGEPDLPDDFYAVDKFSSKSELRLAFAVFDEDGSGKMSKTELVAALLMKGVPLSDGNIKKAMVKC